MRKLPEPTDKAEDVFLDCIANIRDKETKEKLESYKDDIVHATEEFKDKVLINQTYTITEVNENDENDMEKKIIAEVYTERMVRVKALREKYYNKIIASPKNGICPLCGQRIVTTIDHYLPKAKYPKLAVTPINLVPACKDCNKVKGDKNFTNSVEETIHPYFNNVENETWLYAKIIKKNEVSIVFYVKKPDSWEDILYKRVKNHFNMFKLNDLYSVNSAVEINNIRSWLIKVYRKSGSNDVSEILRESYESRKANYLNSWQTAMYRALYESQWFCIEWISKQ